MALSDYQKQVDKWVTDNNYSYWSPHEILARVTEETGELARLINHVYGPKKKKLEEHKQDLGEEISDIIWALASLANVHNINLDESFQQVLDKAYDRDSQRFAKTE